MRLLRILYLVHNLSDPAVARRVCMFEIGGAEVELAGFRRADAPQMQFPQARLVELDITHDGKMLHRLWATLRARYTVRGWARPLHRPDVIVARNLEMLAIAEGLLSLWDDPPALVYECLDLHRLMLREDRLGQAMRRIEQRLMRPASLLIVSSPAFLDHYFDDQGAPPAVMLENKVLAPGAGAQGKNPVLRQDFSPLRIGWFGALRCEISLHALAGLACAMEGRIEVSLRGRPALTEFADFHGLTASTPHLYFLGPYAYPDDLAPIYSQVHFAWAIDFFEEGQNSRWLLPNRIYEGCLNGAIPIALAGTETAAFLERHGIGVVLPDIAPQTLIDLFAGMTPERVSTLARDVAAIDPDAFRCEPGECVALVKRLAGIAGIKPSMEIAA